MIEAGDTARLSVGRTWRWSDNSPERYLNQNLADAQVKLIVNGKYVCDMQVAYSQTNPSKPLQPYYKSDYIAKIGDVVRYEVSHPKFGEAYGETEIPEIVDIEDIKVNFTSIEPQISDVNGELLIKITDTPNKKNYYQLDIYTGLEAVIDGDASNLHTGIIPGERWQLMHPNFDISSEPVFQEHRSAFELATGETSDLLICTDRQFDGTPYTFRMAYRGDYMYYNSFAPRPYQSQANNKKLQGKSRVVGYGYHAPQKKDEIAIYLNSISRSFYEFSMSIEAKSSFTGGLGEIGFGDIVWHKSNVSTGAGIICAKSSSVRFIPIVDLYPSFDQLRQKK